MFVIPNFMENIELLVETVSKIAEHPLAEANYIICLAMEKEEINSKDKAMQIIEQFKGKFYYIHYTVH